MKITRMLNAGVVGIAVGIVALAGCAPRSHFVIAKTSRTMLPTLSPGQAIIARPFDSKRQVLRRYDVVVFHPPVAPAVTWVFRVIGMPGEEISLTDNSITVNGSPLLAKEMPTPLVPGPWLPNSRLPKESPQYRWHLGEDEVFVVGDNLEVAYDSRCWGPLKVSAIVGTVDVKDSALKGPAAKLNNERMSTVKQRRANNGSGLDSAFQDQPFLDQLGQDKP